jgi:hypothetical protein
LSEAGKCIYCRAEINPDVDYRKVEGFEQRRTQGGTNAIRLRKSLDVWACAHCVGRASKGVAPTQQAMI